MPILLGYGYSDITGDDRSLKIFPEFETIEEANPQVQYFCSAYESEADYLKKLASATSFKMPINLTENLKAALNYSKEITRQTDDAVYIITITAIERTTQVKLPSNYLKNSAVQEALAELSNSKYNFYSRFGNSFISEIMYGNEATITIKFKNVKSGLKQQLDSALDANLSGVIDVSSSGTLSGIMKDNHISHEIKIHTRGFKHNQLPKVNVDILELKKWIDEFQGKFSNEVSGTSTHIVMYKTTLYTEVFGNAANPLLDKKLQAHIYDDAIKRCKVAINLYKVYYNDIAHDNQKSQFLSLQEQALSRVERQIEVSQDFSDPEVKQELHTLQETIALLNSIHLDPKIYTFQSSSLDLDVASCWVRGYRYTSPSFQLKVPTPLACNRLTLSVASVTPLSGSLTFLYSSHPHVPYDNLCNTFSVKLISDLGAGQDVTVELPESVDPKNIYFAFHYETRKRLHSAANQEEFTFRTALEYKEADPTLHIDVPRSPRDSLAPV